MFLSLLSSYFHCILFTFNVEMRYNSDKALKKLRLTKMSSDKNL